MRQEVTKLHREALDMRLITEELWARLASQIAPAELTRCLADVRKQVTERYLYEQQELDRKRQELERLAANLHKEQAALIEHRREWKAWVQERNQEIERQAERLIHRELELDTRQQPASAAAEAMLG